MDIIIFILLLAASAFFSGSETAFLSIGKVTFKQIEHMDSPAAKRVVAILGDAHKLIITLLVGNTLVNIAASSVLADIFYRNFGEKGIPFSIVTMTLVVLVFGEVTPKMFSLSNAVNVSFFSSLPLKVFEMIFTPVRVVLEKMSRWIVSSMGVPVVKRHADITEEEIRSLFSIGRVKGVVKEKEKAMIEGILEFKESDAADLMTPRIDVIALDLSMPDEELVGQIKEHQYSRFPVYMHSLDNVVGLIHSKEVLLKPDKPIREMIKRPYFAPESMKIDDLLQELQHSHTHMAIVTDEYGVTSGIVTIEDILEEIVGEIRDELDFEPPDIKKIDQKTFEVNGQTHIDDVNDEIGLDIETHEVDTIGGYFILVAGKIPTAGDSIKVNGYILTVDDVSNNRITGITVTKE